MPASSIYIVPDRVTVIIPTYNYGHFLATTLESVLCQEISDIEIIVVDDGSTDDTKQVLEPYRPKIRYVYQDNAGLSSARNKGIKKSTGEFILFLDADDLLSSNAIETQRKYLQNNLNCDICVCQNRLFSETMVDGNPRIIGSWDLSYSALDVHLCFLNIAPPHAFFCRRQAALDTGGFDSTVDTCADYDFWLRAAVIGHVPYANPLATVYYRRHPDSMSADPSFQYRFDAIMHERVAELLQRHPEFPRQRRVEGLLAFTAGVLRTAEAMQRIHMHGWSELLEIAQNLLEQERKSLEAGNFDWNLLATLFYLRIANVLIRQPFRTLRVTRNMKTTLQTLVGHVTKRSSNLRFCWAVLSSILEKNASLVYEKKEARKLLLKFVKNNFLMTF